MFRSIRLSLICVICFLIYGNTTLGQEGDQEEMMQKWTEFMTPGENHKLLARKAGKWKLHVKIWMAPGTPPSESDATATYSMIMGGRYLADETRGDFGGMPFEGHGLSGYDNGLKKFVYTWIDNVGTGVLTGTGDYDAGKKEYEYETMFTDPISGKSVKGRMIERAIDDDHFVMESYQKGPDGKEFQSMEITYERQK